MSVSSEFQKAILDALLADAGVGALVGDRIYDGAPSTLGYPCITFGPSEVDVEQIQCVAAQTEALQIDIWSRDKGRMRPCKDIVGAVLAALRAADLSLTTNALASFEIEGARYMLDPDGISAHGVVTVVAELETV